MTISKFRGSYYFLSNFYPCHIEYLGNNFKNLEAAYQASKSLDKSTHQWFATLDGPQAKAQGKNIQIRADWEQVKLGIMEELLRQKFSNEILRRKLIATDGDEIVEMNSWGDRFWGTDLRGVGENHLGKLLMCIRSDVRIRSRRSR